jgi:ABC-2 type transport system permease protein
MTINSPGKSDRQNDIYLLLLTIGILIVVNVIVQHIFFRIDLTTEKRYTISDESKKILSDLKEVVFIRVYLDGDLNIPFKKFQGNIRDFLDELHVYGRNNIQYEFFNPLEDISKQAQGKTIQELYDKGLRPTNILQRDKEGGTSEKIIFPSAIIRYKDFEIPLNLLVNNPGQNSEQNLNSSKESLEYSFISAIKNITSNKTEKIAFIEGHGELNEYEVNDISNELSKSYQVDRGTINGKPGILDEYKAIIIAKPVVPFSEPDKFVIDQYIMNGGKVLWLIDAVQVSLDSMINGNTMAINLQLNLDDLLFRYGFRINPVLVQDIQCNLIPVNVALQGSNPNFKPVPWLYFPLISPHPGHPVTQNQNMIFCRFANTIDTIEGRKGIKKIPLLTTSQNTRNVITPAIVSLNEVRSMPQKSEFNKSNLLIGAIFEGKFESAFKNRGMAAYFKNAVEVKETSKATKMAVIADGDIIRNDVRYTSTGPAISLLGYDRFTRQTFGNKDFLVNLIEYLANDNNLLKLRGREFNLRLLNKEKMTSQRLFWIILNISVPSVIVILFGFSLYFIRKHKYSKK